jgi:phospholipase/carboxylesterase
MTHTRLLERVGCSVRPYIDEGFYKSLVETTGPQRVLTFMPTGFESTYEYPLIVFFHRDGSSERQIMRLVPHLSRRNFICMGLRGMVPMYRTDGRLGYSWDNDAGLTTELEDYVFAAIADAYDRLPVHADRIFLAGIGEGATQAYRLAFSYPNKFAGVISLNGKLPQRGPLWRLQQTRQLPVFIGHGRDNEQVTFAEAKQDHRLLYTAGMEVAFAGYPTGERLHPEMLRDVNHWTMKRVTGE